jgi:hypothetical protein
MLLRNSTDLSSPVSSAGPRPQTHPNPLTALQHCPPHLLSLPVGSYGHKPVCCSRASVLLIAHSCSPAWALPHNPACRQAYLKTHAWTSKSAHLLHVWAGDASVVMGLGVPPPRLLARVREGAITPVMHEALAAGHDLQGSSRQPASGLLTCTLAGALHAAEGCLHAGVRRAGKGLSTPSCTACGSRRWSIWGCHCRLDAHSGHSQAQMQAPRSPPSSHDQAKGAECRADTAMSVLGMPYPRKH